MLDESCVTGSENSCPDAACDDEGDCTGGSECAIGTCLEGFCYYRADHEECESHEYCHPEHGCRTVSSEWEIGVDAGTMDAGGDDGPATMCPNYRPDVPMARRRPVHFQPMSNGMLDTAIYQVALLTDRIVASTDDGLMHNMIGTTTWAPWLEVNSRVDAILVTSSNIYVGADGWDRVLGSSLPAYNFIFSTDVQNVITFGVDPDDETRVFAGTRESEIFQWQAHDAYAQRGTVTGCGGVTSIAPLGGGSELVIAGTSCPDTLLASADNGATDFVPQQTSSANTVPTVIPFRDDPNRFLMVAGIDGACDAVYTCNAPCNEIEVLGDSELMAGTTVHLPTGFDRGCNLAQSGDVIVAGSSNEVWISHDRGDHFYMIHPLLTCGMDTLYEIEIDAPNSYVYIATSAGLYRFTIADAEN